MATNDAQPPPVHNDGRSIWELVVEDMQERDRIGEAKYGTRLQAHNGRDPLVDAYQEGLDLVVYLRQLIEERGGVVDGAIAFGPSVMITNQECGCPILGPHRSGCPTTLNEPRA